MNNRKKNNQTGQWDDEPCFLDVKAFNTQSGRKTADVAEQYLRKGHLCFITGHMVMEQWEDKNGGGRRSKLVVVVDDLQLMPKGTNGESNGGSRSSGGYSGGYDGGDEGGDPNAGYGNQGQEQEVPF